jgi:hypothetical protein
LQMKEEKTGRSFLDSKFSIMEFEKFEYLLEGCDEGIRFKIKFKELFGAVDKMDVSWKFTNVVEMVQLEIEQRDESGLILRRREITIPELMDLKLLQVLESEKIAESAIVDSNQLLKELKVLGSELAQIAIKNDKYLTITEFTELSKNMVLLPIEGYASSITTTLMDSNIDNQTVDIKYLIKVLMKLKTKYKKIQIVLPSDANKPLCFQFGGNVSFYMVKKNTNNIRKIP